MLTTSRLKLRALEDADAPFIVELLNDPAFLEYIGDRGVRTEAQAREYIAKLKVTRATHGYALYGVAELRTGTLTGLCGLVRREALSHADLGFAFLPAFRRKGYAREATLAVLAEAETLGVKPILAICSPHNVASRRLLEQVGFRFEKMMVLPGAKAEADASGAEPERPGNPGQSAETCLYELTSGRAAARPEST